MSEKKATLKGDHALSIMKLTVNLCLASEISFNDIEKHYKKLVHLVADHTDYPNLG